MGSATPSVKQPLAGAGSLSAKKQHGRVINSVADYLRSHLRVPNVYIEPRVTILKKADVLAVDAAGSGDIHIVEVKLFSAPPTSAMIRSYIDQVKAVPGHYKYIAMPRNGASLSLGTQLFSNDGIGRIGLFFISQITDSLPTVDLVIKPERFRMDGADLARIERYLNITKPDMSVRV
jgi:hypothetical protein